MGAIGYLAVSLAIVIGSLAPVLAIGKIASKGLESIGKNIDSTDSVQTAMIMAIAFAEAVAIYCLVIALVLIFS